MYGTRLYVLAGFRLNSIVGFAFKGHLGLQILVEKDPTVMAVEDGKTVNQPHICHKGLNKP